MVLSQATTSDAGNVVSALSSLAALDPEDGKEVSAAIKVAWAIISWASNGGSTPPSFNTTRMVEATAGTLAAAANDLNTAMIGGLNSSVSVVLSNAGLLATVNARIAAGQSFSFALNLNPAENSELNNQNAVYQAAVIMMTKMLVCAGFPLNAFYCNQLGGYTNTQVIVIDDSLFGLKFMYSGFFGGPNPLNPNGGTNTYVAGGSIIIGTYVADGTNGYPTYTSLPQTYDALLNDAAQSLCQANFQQSEIFSWTFATTNIVQAPPLPTAS